MSAEAIAKTTDSPLSFVGSVAGASYGKDDQQSQRYVKVGTDSMNWYVIPPSIGEDDMKCVFTLVMLAIESIRREVRR